MTRYIAFCLLGISVVFVGCSRYSKASKRPLSAVTITADQKGLLGQLQRIQDPNAKLGFLLDKANESRKKLAGNPSNPISRANYNFAVARIVEIIQAQKLAPWDAPVVCNSSGGDPWRLRLTPPDPRPEYHPSRFQMVPAERYDFKGKLIGARVLKQGLGAPTVVSAKDLDLVKVDRFAQGNQVFYGLTTLIRFDGKDCEMVLADPLNVEDVSLDGNVYPLAADFQAPLALSLAELSPRKSEIAVLFKPDKYERTARLARLQPYNPKKIPILCIHGLGDSAATWMPLIDFLRGDEEIRKHYQFWYFGYPSGLPYPVITAMLRRQLDQFTKTYPDHRDLVVIGHSMGGMISRSLITDSGSTLWDTYYDKPPEKMPFSVGTRNYLKNVLIFKARPDISRVIYASASHRGSEHATNFIGRLGAKIIGNPITEQQVSEEALRYMRPELANLGRKHLPNSVDVLDPDSLFLKTVDTLPPKPGIPYHSIIGDRGRGGNLDRTKPQSSDGIVPYWSSHLDGAASEEIIPSEHWSIRHPLGMAEIKRILLKHVR